MVTLVLFSLCIVDVILIEWWIGQTRFVLDRGLGAARIVLCGLMIGLAAGALTMKAALLMWMWI